MPSPLSAVVVRWFVALEQAEAGCLADNEWRALRREREAERRAQYDRDLVAQNDSGDL